MLSEETRRAYIELNKAAGTFAEISEDNLSTYNRLIDSFGLSKELAQDLYRLSVLRGQNLKETAKDEFVRIAESMPSTSSLS